MSLPDIARLAYWLGPWTDDEQIPPTARVRDLPVPPRGPADRAFSARLYEPVAGAHGALLVVPGLHPEGPADPRLDRVCRIFADARILVLCPFLPDFAELRVAQGLIDDTVRAFELLESLPSRPKAVRPGVLSISFGSLPALRLASSAEHAERIGGVVTFGGYAEFRDAVRFSLLGRDGLPHDPLNRPAVFTNLVPYMPSAPADKGPLYAAWLRFVHATWGKAEMKERARYEPVAREIAETLPDEQRELFLMGCGVVEGGLELCLDAIERSGSDADLLDPRPYMHGIVAPAHFVHGRDDDVIPFTEAQALLDAMPQGADAHTWLTGFYGHSGSSGLLEHLRNLSRLGGELRSMVGILGAIHSSATARRR